MKIVLVTLAALALIPAAAQARAFGISGTSVQYRAVESMHPTIRDEFVSFGVDLVPELRSDLALKTTAMFTLTHLPDLTRITAGQNDRYLKRTARAIRAYRGAVYIRLAAEMNGDWWPWSGDPQAFVAAWRHVWNVFHAAGATNVRWIWAPDLLSYEPEAEFETVTSPYWPGAAYVNVIGPTMVEFAYESNCEVPCRFERIDWLRDTYGKPVWLAETKVDLAEAVPWLESLRTELTTRPWVTAVIWSETPSVGEASDPSATGNMDWSLTGDPFDRRLLAAAVSA